MNNNNIINKSTRTATRATKIAWLFFLINFNGVDDADFVDVVIFIDIVVVFVVVAV